VDHGQALTLVVFEAGIGQRLADRLGCDLAIGQQVLDAPVEVRARCCEDLASSSLGCRRSRFCSASTAKASLSRTCAWSNHDPGYGIGTPGGSQLLGRS